MSEETKNKENKEETKSIPVFKTPEEVSDYINKVLNASDCVIRPICHIVENRIIQEVNIAKKPKESKIIAPNSKIAK